MLSFLPIPFAEIPALVRDLSNYTGWETSVADPRSYFVPKLKLFLPFVLRPKHVELASTWGHAHTRLLQETATMQGAKPKYEDQGPHAAGLSLRQTCEPDFWGCL